MSIARQHGTSTSSQPWATGCTAQADGLHGHTANGAYRFVITREVNSTPPQLVCTYTPLGRRRFLYEVALGSFFGVIAGVATALALGARVAVAVGGSGIAALTAALVTARMPSTEMAQGSSDVWVASDGSSGPPQQGGGGTSTT